MAKAPKRLTAQDDEMIAQLYRMGKSVNEISSFTGFAWETVKGHLVTMGLIEEEKPKPVAKKEVDVPLDRLIAVMESIDGHLAAMDEALTMMALRGDEDPLSKTKGKAVTKRS